MGHHDHEAARSAQHHPANRLRLDYRAAPPRKPPGGRIIDIHTHVRISKTTDLFFEAAQAYGVERIISMSPPDEITALHEAYPDRLAFIAVPRWREFDTTKAFRRQWLTDLATFREQGARIMKLWSAPPLRGELGLTLEAPFLRPVIREALDLGYNFMVHVGDPSVWWQPGGRYADTARFGSKHEQYAQLEFLLEAVRPRFVIGAHLGGNIEEPDFLHDLLERYPNCYLDTSATKWIVREVARRPQRVRDFMIRNADRILFGSDIVVDDEYDFDHYASRFWAHQMMWETDCRGESPIEDPDADDPPKLVGLDLPSHALRRIYYGNATRLEIWPDQE